MRRTESHAAPSIDGTPGRAVSAAHGPNRAAGAHEPHIHTVEHIISWLLRIGVWSSITIVVAGLVMLAVTDRDVLLHGRAGGLPSLASTHLHGQPVQLHSYGGVLDSVRNGQAYGVIMLGLLVLLFTPVMRVAVSIVAFVIERDHLYAALTAIVLGLLILAMLLGKAGG